MNTALLKKRLAELGIGHTVNMILVVIFDYLIYPFVIYHFGILKGGVIMTIWSSIICWLTFIAYDYMKRDWLGIEAVKSLRDSSGGRIKKITSWFLQKSDPVVMIFLSIQTDPFITTAYMRHGVNGYNGLSARDRRILISSILIGNIYWTFVSWTGVSIIEYVVQQIKTL